MDARFTNGEATLTVENSSEGDRLRPLTGWRPTGQLASRPDPRLDPIPCRTTANSCDPLQSRRFSRRVHRFGSRIGEGPARALSPAPLVLATITFTTIRQPVGSLVYRSSGNRSGGEQPRLAQIVRDSILQAPECRRVTAWLSDTNEPPQPRR